jgi:shikimate dehydrogenase
LAPAFHTIAGQMLGLDVTYELLPRDLAFATELDGLLEELGGAGYRGVNITVPFKASAWQAASDASDEVVSTGVANTLVLGPAGPTNAFNTDYSGFKWAYRRRFPNASPGTVALLGAGGVGTATAAALVDLGASAVRIYDIVADRSHALADILRRRNVAVQVDVVASAESAVDGVDGVVNGTPVGMYLQPGTPVDLAAVRDQRWLFDAIYSPIETELMAWAADAKLARISGFDLFLGQAIDAFEIFTGHVLASSVLEELENRMRVLERERSF